MLLDKASDLAGLLVLAAALLAGACGEPPEDDSAEPRREVLVIETADGARHTFRVDLAPRVPAWSPRPPRNGRRD